MDGGDAATSRQEDRRFWPGFTPGFFSSPVAGQFFV